VNQALPLQLAALYEDMKLPWRARPYYLKVLEIDPENAKALERLSLLDSETTKKETAKPKWLGRLFPHSPK
jgi:hypothetical protein